MNDEKSLNHVLKEKERIGKVSQIKELVFGAQDGLLVPLGVVSSVAGAFNNNHIVLVAGISEALAGAFSMATGAYLASQAERQVHIAEIKKEEKAIEKNPKKERQELVFLLKSEGLSEQNAEIIVDRLATSKEAYLNTMIQKELGIEPHPPDTPTRDALFVGISYLISAMIPLLPYFFLQGQIAIASSILATLAALFSIGLVKGKVASLPFIKSGLQVLAIGAGSGIGGYLLGSMLPYVIGLR